MDRGADGAGATEEIGVVGGAVFEQAANIIAATRASRLIRFNDASTAMAHFTPHARGAYGTRVDPNTVAHDVRGR